ncbi:DeoR/GlpR family DNA-binding transcription regulator [Rhizobium sp. TRM95111]|uniref:DeoR/GlpR family DNA-binding transcription regulator n=1 Tax=Rhizobium alarense TaxID=2846851 RepID=UPI001F1B4D45|nr:DeoR/GlpR family DNA-binding transcription regulator [Rhizobium alarense]MCF3640952.1 DeoR/GlpR family DNA-binding transcription regulator [Rhizobium alarense]
MQKRNVSPSSKRRQPHGLFALPTWSKSLAHSLRQEKMISEGPVTKPFSFKGFFLRCGKKAPTGESVGPVATVTVTAPQRDRRPWIFRSQKPRKSTNTPRNPNFKPEQSVTLYPAICTHMHSFEVCMDNGLDVPALSNHREREILEELRLAGGSSRIQFLAERLHVSEETIRRNIKTLEANGLVTKVHGGVHMSKGSIEPPLHFRMGENAEAKRIIAAKVATLIENGDALFLDIGSTTAFIAVALQKHRELFIVTNSLSVAHALATRNNNRIFFAGGELRRHDGGAFGAEAVSFVERFNVQHAILSVTAINAQSGFMIQDMQEAEMSRAVAHHAQNRIIVADSRKFGRIAPITIAEPQTYNMLVTDAEPPEDIRAMLAANNIEVHIADARNS